MAWSDLAVGAVILAASLSFLSAVLLTVGRERSDRDEEEDRERTLVR